ncbi:uncharacterized protein LOC129869897 isoform X2 [Solanum dulcamara]|uniref:uncharacterized protein LOC129869897 isoform X2 n=1 Tax=Solanum dulcamara TaxID=45834 RepID=UPI0024860047|nr:uncharacterized protein LOC129869897 isoform X2 [Solanum dulcamara]
MDLAFALKTRPISAPILDFCSSSTPFLCRCKFVPLLCHTVEKPNLREYELRCGFYISLGDLFLRRSLCLLLSAFCVSPLLLRRCATGSCRLPQLTHLRFGRSCPRGINTWEEIKDKGTFGMTCGCLFITSLSLPYLFFCFRTKKIAMDTIKQEKVRRFEEFIDRRLKPDLVHAIAERDKVFEQQIFFSDLRSNIENLEKNSVTNLKTLVNIGSEVYVQADVPDSTHIFVDVGLGFHVEFTWSEALNYISAREEKLARLRLLVLEPTCSDLVVFPGANKGIYTSSRIN